MTFITLLAAVLCIALCVYAVHKRALIGEVVTTIGSMVLLRRHTMTMWQRFTQTCHEIWSTIVDAFQTAWAYIVAKVKAAYAWVKDKSIQLWKGLTRS